MTEGFGYSPNPVRWKGNPRRGIATACLPREDRDHWRFSDDGEELDRVRAALPSMGSEDLEGSMTTAKELV